MKLRGLCLVVVVWVCAVSAARADVIPAGDGRGASGVLTFELDFWGLPGVGPCTLTTVAQEAPLFNPQPAPHTQVHFNSEVSVLGSLLGRESILHLSEGAYLGFRFDDTGAQVFERSLTLHLTTRPEGGALDTFNVGTGDSGLGISAPPWSFPHTVAAEVLASTVHPDGWRTDSFQLLLAPDAELAGVALNFSAYPAFVDRVVLEVRYIPEPATLLLLAPASVTLLRPRRQSH